MPEALKFEFRGLPIPEGYAEMEGHINLWRAVIDCAIDDVLYDTPERERSLMWLRGIASVDEVKRGEQSGFYEVADLALLHPGWIQEKAQKMFQLNLGEELL